MEEVIAREVDDEKEDDDEWEGQRAHDPSGTASNQAEDREPQNREGDSPANSTTDQVPRFCSDGVARALGGIEHPLWVSKAENGKWKK